MTMPEVKDWLDRFHWTLYPLLTMLTIWLSSYSVRRWWPRAWEWAANIPSFADRMTAMDVGLHKAWQALPSALLGALGMWFAGGGSPLDLILGALYGLTAPVWHEFLKWLPFIPYQGQTKNGAIRVEESRR